MTELIHSSLSSSIVYNHTNNRTFYKKEHGNKRKAVSYEIMSGLKKRTNSLKKLNENVAFEIQKKNNLLTHICWSLY